MRICCVLVMLLSARVLGENFKFYLAIKDKMDPSWINAQYSSVASKIGCASICYRKSGVHFGYKDHECYLLSSSLKREECSIEDCADTGMKIYKMNVEKPKTTPPPVTTEEVTTTTMATTSTTEAEGYTCDPPDGLEAEVKCPIDSYMIKAIASNKPFYRDLIAVTCSSFKDMLVGEEEEVRVFRPVSKRKLDMSVYCSGEDYIIFKYKICVKDQRLSAIVIHCRKILDTSIIKGVVNATSDDKHVLVNCGSKTGLQKMWFEDAGHTVTRTIFQCLELDGEENMNSEGAEGKASDANNAGPG